MKTAMQELIEYLENIYYVKEILDWEDIKKNIIKKDFCTIIKIDIRTIISKKLTPLIQILKDFIEPLRHDNFNDLGKRFSSLGIPLNL
jgi:hypothetical protein